MNIPILNNASQDQIVKQFENMHCSKEEAIKGANAAIQAMHNSKRVEQMRAIGRANFIKEASSFFKNQRSSLYK